MVLVEKVHVQVMSVCICGGNRFNNDTVTVIVVVVLKVVVVVVVEDVMTIPMLGILRVVKMALVLEN